VLLERLAKNPVARRSRKTIAQELDGHLCRCTGYIKYHEAVRDVILPIEALPDLAAAHGGKALIAMCRSPKQRD
jgi:xanthine dehydrogenase iron-sulfur cluster and FAD-binding subunit A